ncbi:MAG: hypothetical protein H6739_29335 [Alphaproteobacteria bacterium]|nr:hypothetical protein [Alphaproteobacteria bacterium]
MTNQGKVHALHEPVLLPGERYYAESMYDPDCWVCGQRIPVRSPIAWQKGQPIAKRKCRHIACVPSHEQHEQNLRLGIEEDRLDRLNRFGDALWARMQDPDERAVILRVASEWQRQAAQPEQRKAGAGQVLRFPGG